MDQPCDPMNFSIDWISQLADADASGMEKAQASCLVAVSPSMLQEIERELSQTPIPWCIEYSEYQSAGWHTASLLNRTGCATDAVISDGDVQPTDLLQVLPRTRAFIDSLELDIFWARLARLEPNSFLWEHVDYAEIPRSDTMRLHIPITTNPYAQVVFRDAALHMTRGYVWKLNPRGVHGAANLGFNDRTHILIDCHLNSRLASLMETEDLPPCAMTKLPEPPPGLIYATCETAKKLVIAGHILPAERCILQLFHSYALAPGMTIDLLLKLYEDLGHREQAELWNRRRALFLGQSNESLFHRGSSPRCKTEAV